MELVLSVKQSGDYTSGFKTSRIFGAEGGTIGRAPDAHWVLPDEKNELSRYHLHVSFDNGRFFLTDDSSNGTFTDDHSRFPKGQPMPVHHNECLRLGSYLIQARITETPEVQRYKAAPLLSGQTIIPDDAFLGKEPLSVLIENTSEAAPSILEKNLSETPAARPASATRATPATAAAPGSDYQLREHIPVPVLKEPPEQKATPHTESTIIKSSVADKALQAFEQALGTDLSSLEEEEKIIALRSFGEMLKASIQGLQQSLRTRTELKNELRLGVTTLQGQGNNPLKFCTDYTQTLQIMTDGQSGYMKSVLAIKSAFHDLQSHQVASLAATRAALKQTVTNVSPKQLVYQFSQGAYKRKWRSQDASCWQAYTRYHQSLEENDDWFHALMSGTYATVYEEQVQLLNTAFQREE